MKWMFSSQKCLHNIDYELASCCEQTLEIKHLSQFKHKFRSLNCLLQPIDRGWWKISICQHIALPKLQNQTRGNLNTLADYFNNEKRLLTDIRSLKFITDNLFLDFICIAFRFYSAGKSTVNRPSLFYYLIPSSWFSFLSWELLLFHYKQGLMLLKI